MATPNSPFLKTELKAFIAEGQTLRAIECLRASEWMIQDRENSNRINLLSARFHLIEADFRDGGLVRDGHQAEVIKINRSLLDLIDQLPEGPLAILELPPLPMEIKRPGHPFTGLHWFTREDARIFFGREKNIRELYEYVTEGERLILLYGQSGVGKSSLLHAGLLPRLEHAWQTAYCRRDRNRGLSAQLEDLLAQSAPKPQLIILDQVEEILTNPNSDIREEGETLAGLLHRALEKDKRRQFILGFRKEFLAEVKTWLKAHPAMDPVEIFLQALDRPGILESIEGAAKDRELKRKYKNLEIEPGLSGLIAEDILQDQQSHQAPLLQMLLRKMWDEVSDKPSHAVFDQELYSALRQSSLGGMLDDQLKRLAALFPNEVEGGLALDVLAFYTTSGAWVTSRGRTDKELQQDYRDVPGIMPFKHALTSLFLLTDNSSGKADAGSRLAHDSLAPLVVERLQSSDRIGQRARRILESKQLEINQGTASFKDADDISTLEGGRPFMRAWTTKELEALTKGKKVVSLQIEREQAMRRSNFEFAKTRIETAIIGLDYDFAFAETLQAIDLNYGLEELAAFLQEIAFIGNACGQIPRTLEALQALSNLGLGRFQPLTAHILRLEGHFDSRANSEILAQLDPERHQFLKRRYISDMISIPGGDFIMGSDDEGPKHKVQVDGFLLGRTPVTYWQYYLYLQLKGIDTENPGWGRLGNNPAVYVSWLDAVQFCNWLSAMEDLQPVYQIDNENVMANWHANGYRLPTEAEWEYAARGGPEQKPYEYSGSNILEEVGWYYENSKNRTQPVALKQSNSLGLKDMSGNVWEWCWDWYDEKYYKTSPSSNPKGPSTGSYRVLRGGSWGSLPQVCRVANRIYNDPGVRSNGIGFRLARTL